MNKFNIKYWDDKETGKSKIKGALLDIQGRFPSIEHSPLSLEDLVNIDNVQKACENVDLLIIDILNTDELKRENDKPEKVGFTILTNLKSLGIKIPVIAYTEVSDDVINSLYHEFPELKVQRKSEDLATTKLKSLITEFVLLNLPQQYSLLESDSIELEQIISLFGKSELNQILESIRNSYDFAISKDTQIEISKMTTGFSGANLFRFSYKNTPYILKVSRDINSLETEYENSKKYYREFPSKLFNYISSNLFYSSDKNAVGIIIKLIEDSKTLFDFIIETDSAEKITVNLERIFLQGDCLNKHYSDKQQGKKSWTEILSKFKGGKFLRVQKAYEDLKPLLASFDIDDVKKFVQDDYYREFNKDLVKREGQITLNHNDFHSKNTLIQNENTPFLIDTGLMGYSYWVSDLCRLLVDLFITGMDIGKREYYDINHIQKNLELGKKLIDLTTIPDDNGNEKNNRFIFTINWLTSNAENIYSTCFSKWEFQIGLMKEFLTVATRNETVPHSKRALSLELAQYCMVRATENYAADNI